MPDPASLTPADRAARIRNVALLAGYDPALGANAILEILVDLICYGRAHDLPFEDALDRARMVTGQRLATLETQERPATETLVNCDACARYHPTWAACLATVDPTGRTIRLELDPVSGRVAAHVERWYAKLPGALVDAEQQMAQA